MKERYHKLTQRFIEDGIHVIDLTKSQYNSDFFIMKILIQKVKNICRRSQKNIVKTLKSSCKNLFFKIVFKVFKIVC